MNRFLVHHTVIILVFTIFMLSTTSAIGQIEFPQDSGIPFIKNFAPSDYQNVRQVWQIDQDSRGILYYANTSGVLEYDGSNWREIPIPGSDVVRALFIDSEDRIIVGGYNDFGVLEADSLGKPVFKSLLDRIKSKHENFGEVYEILELNGDLFFRTTPYLFQLDGDSIISHEAETGFLKSFIVNETFYVQDSRTGLKKLVGDSLKMIPGGERFASIRVRAMLALDDEKILIGSVQEGFKILDGIQYLPFNTGNRSYFLDSVIFDTVVLPNGHVAVLTLRGGIAFLDSKGQLLQILNSSVGLAKDQTYCAYVDSENGIWVGMDQGIDRIEYPSPMTMFNEKMGLDDVLQGSYHFENEIYVATNQGVEYLNISDRTAITWTPFSSVEGLTMPCLDFYKMEDQLLVTSGDGVYHLSGNTGRNIAQCYAMSVLRPSKFKNILLVGNADGLLSFKSRGKDYERFDYVEGGLSNSYGIVEDDNGVIWLSSYFDGLACLDFGNEFTISPTYVRFDTSDGLPSNSYNKISKLSKGLFVTSQGGLRRINQPSDISDPTWKPGFLPDSSYGSFLADTTRIVYAVAEDKHGNLWAVVDGQAGVSNLNEDGSYSWQVRHLSGIGIGDIVDVQVDDKGIVWFTGYSGLARFDPAQDDNHDHCFQVSIRNIISSGDTLFYGGMADDKFLNKGNSLSLEFSKKALRFVYSASSFERNGQVQYQIWLEGFEDGWSNLTSENVKDYTNLPEGKYTFHVKATNIYSEVCSPVGYQFEIRPPWHRTGFAYTAYVLIILFIGWSTIKLRLTAMERKTLRLERKVEARTLRLQRKTRQLEESNQELQLVLEGLQSYQNSLIQSEKMAALGKLVAGITHEVNTPVGAVVSASDVINRAIIKIEEVLEIPELRSTIPESTKLFQSLQALKTSNEISADASQRIASIIDNLKKFARLDEAEFQIANLNEGIDSSLNILHSEFGDQVTIIKDYGDIPGVFCNPSEMNQIFMHLIRNAVQSFEDNEGIISLITEKIGDEVKVSIQDNGVGIPRKQLKSLFDFSFSANSKRIKMGMGLMTSHQIIENHQGRIEVISDEGKGSTFSIFLPINRT